MWKEESGQGLVEYGLLVALIVVIVGVVLVVLRGSLTALFDSITGEINKAKTNVTTTPPTTTP